MPIEIILITIFTIGLIIAVINDIKKREVPDWISYSLIFIAISFKTLQSIVQSEIKIFIIAVTTLIIFTLIGNLLYHFKIWGGGDSKLLIAISTAFSTYPVILLNYFEPKLNIPLPAILLLHILLMGSLYGLIYSTILAIKNKNIFIKELKKNFNENKQAQISILALILIIPIILIKDYLIKTALSLIFIISLLPLVLLFVKSVENISLIKKVKINKITEGDWLAQDVKIKNKILLPKSLISLTKNHIALLKKNKIKYVSIKYGIPFVPSIFLATITSLIIGNII